MESLRELYRIGPGPSSSHSLGVRRACQYYYSQYPDKDHYLCELYGSLSLTGRGHMTDKVIYDFFGKDKVEVVFKNDEVSEPNTMMLYTLEGNMKTNKMVIYSIGGGAIRVEGVEHIVDDKVYKESSLTEIQKLCSDQKISLSQYVYNCEPDIKPYLKTVCRQMLKVVDEGLGKEGYLPGELHLKRVGGSIYRRISETDDPSVIQKLKLTAYAYSAMEENACGGTVVTAPTLGASGVLASLVKYYHEKGTSEDLIADGLAVGGLIGNLVKTNATISGAAGGCQAEIGTACAMGAAFASVLEGLTNREVEMAAEIAMEHFLGLTCDPVGGYVQIPCIERNGVAVLRSIDSMIYGDYFGEIKDNRVSFDMVVEVMNHTGRQIPIELRETSLGGLALEMNLHEVKNDL